MKQPPLDRRKFIQILGSSALIPLAGCATTGKPSGKLDLAMIDGMATAAAIKNGDVSAVEVVQAAIERIELLNPAINAVVATNYERALATAAGKPVGKLWGVPILIKDLSAIKGIPYTYGSKMFADNIASEETVYTQGIRDAGMLLLGKSNTPEFGLLPSTESLLLGPCHNPWKLGYSSGGSSGGAAAAVASRMVPIAQSSDGGGSIRIPGAMNGVLGLKPSRGRFPDQGVPVRFWDISIRNMNTMTVRDTAMTLALTESQSGDLSPTGFVGGASDKNYRIALSLSGADGIQPSAEIAEACQRTARLLESLGHSVDIVDNTPMHDAELNEAFLTNWAVAAAGLVNTVEQRTGKRAEETGLLEPATTGIARLVSGDLEQYREGVVTTLARIQSDTYRFMDDYDLWLTPVTTTVAPEHGYLAPTIEHDTLIERVFNFVPYTLLHNVAGTPAISIPAGYSEQSGLPLAVQVAASLGDEDKLLDIAYQLESEAPWAQRIPALSKQTLGLG